MIYRKIQRLKAIIFFSLALMLLAFLSYPLIPIKFDFDSNTYTKEKKEVTLIKGIKINEIEAIYDKTTDTYLFPISQNQKVILDIKVFSNRKIEFVTTNEYLKNNKIFKVDLEKPIKVIAYNNSKYDTTYITFTTLPIVNINSNKDIDTIDQKGTVKLVQSNNSDLIFDNTKVRIRGRYSQMFDKKSYRLTFDEDFPILGMQYDDVWILDGLYIDTSKIRNKLAFDLWNLMNSYNSDENLDIDLKSQYVEVFANEEYIGLYNLKEPVNRKRLGLSKKSINNSGVLLKGEGIGKLHYDDFEATDVNYFNYSIFEMKYPNNVPDTSTYWQRILNKLKYLYSDRIFDEDTLKDHFYIENIVDYKILYTVTKAIDNCFIRNVYMSLKNINSQRVILTPWDFDFSSGLTSDSRNPRLSKTEYDKYNEITCRITKPEQPILTETLKQRYKELRKEVITLDNIYLLLDEYLKMLTVSGSTKRDANRWYQYNIEEEISNIKTWYKNRLDYLDEYFEGLYE